MIFTTILRRGASIATVLGLLGWVFATEWDGVRAFSTSGGKFTAATATYYVNPGFSDASAGSAAQQITALQNAASAWHNQGGINFSFAYGGQTAVSAVAYDSTNTVFYSPTDGGGALAVCYYWMSGGSMLQFDIQFFDSDGAYDFIWAHTPTLAQFDIQSVATHEFGHALGLGHSAIAGATMYPSVSPGDTSPRTLAPDDIAGVQSLYAGAPVEPTVTSCSPSSAFVDGGATVTVTGQNFNGTNLTVTFGGQPATNVQFVSTTQITCTVPPGSQVGTVPVNVCCSGACGSASVFSYTSLRLLNQPVLGSVSAIQFHVPSLPLRVYQAYISLGTSGVPISSFGNVLDTRVLPLTFDSILTWNLYSNPSWVGNFYGQLNAAGGGLGFFYVPTAVQVQGATFHFAFIVWDVTAQSGIAHVSSRVSATVQ